MKKMSLATIVMSVALYATPSAGVPALVAQSPTQREAKTLTIPGVPVKPDLVTVVPFYSKDNETPMEQTKVVLEAEVDGIRGVFILDTGDFDVDLNRTFLQPNAKGGVDSITDANRIPEHGWDTVGVKLKIGTITVDLTTPQFARSNPRPGKVVLDHIFGNFSWVFAPRLGNIGVPALEPFETIVDYPNKRIIFIKVDSTGKRLVDVPAYTKASSVPLVRLRDQTHWGLQAQLNGATNTLLLDTGNPGGPGEEQAADQMKLAAAAGKPVFDIDRAYPRGFGYPFLRELGVVGFNFRSGELILYK